MPDMLGTGLSSLRALQRAMDTTSHNIANASTEGYTRQRVDFATRQPEMYGGNWIGTGVNVTTVKRVYDEFLATQVRSSGGNLARLDAFATQAERLDNLLGDTGNGLGASLQSFTDAINEVSTTPSSISARQVLISQANALVDRLKGYDDRLDQMSGEVDARLSVEAADINNLARSIAKLNGDITVATQQTGQPPNDLLDQRDQLIDQLSGKVGVTVVKEGVASLNVFIGTGQPLVLGNVASSITTTKDPLDPTRVQMALQTQGGTIDVSRSIAGGTLGGLLDWRREMLDPARNELGRITLAVASQVNAQHREGMDLSGALGGDFFNVGGVGIGYAGANTGTATVSATRTDIGAITADDYVLTRTATGYTLRHEAGGQPVPFTGTGTVADPFVFDGLSVTITAGAAVGDQFTIHPTGEVIEGFSVAITDPGRIAAAAPIRGSAASANTGSGKITAGEVLDSGNASLLNTVNIVFTSATTYSVDGGPDIAYAAGGNIDVNGWRVQISGQPAVGDTFTVRNNAGAVGDNRNAFALADAMRAGVLENGTVSVTAAVERMTGNLGLQTRAAQMSRDAESAVHDSDLASLDAVSGVNLDEEAANLLRYQQAYAAAAQIIAVSGQMFDTLINAVRR
ncbi:MAG TPA: flagellar hook-associated protein FlgK [Steroidobacteraceae bacterium]|nr:flagellar hook-associated protein FlgK [Steroidobacteraceae bacterium]